MKVSELIELLEGADADAEVRMAIQPSYPLQFELLGIAASDDLDTDKDTPEPVMPIVWLVQGDHPSDSPYGRSQVWDAVQHY